MKCLKILFVTHVILTFAASFALIVVPTRIWKHYTSGSYFVIVLFFWNTYMNEVKINIFWF